jgi:MFS family permease
VSQGAVATAQGIGASLSNTVAGLIVVSAGYSTAFLTLASVALVALLIFFLAMPETGKLETRSAPGASPAEAQNERKAVAPAG